MSRTWAKITPPEPVSFDEIMSEELARDLQTKENTKFAEELLKTTPTTMDENATASQDMLDLIQTKTQDSCESDAIIARMLQMQFDKEYDENLKRTEQKFNGTSKVSVSFENYRRVPQNFDFESDSEEEEVEDIRDRKDWDRFDVLKKQFDSMPSCGYKMVNGSIVTKHDVVMSGRKNACKLLSFPPEFQTGDGEDFDLKLSNKVFNNLKRHSQNEETRRHKNKDKKEDRATAEFGLDEYTTHLLYKLVEQALVDKINGIVSIGKESVILHAEGNMEHEEKTIPQDCVVKVYKTTLSEFKQRDKYIRDDYRFKDRIGKQTSRKIINIWAEKEMHNLHRLKNANIPCPDVIYLKKHILVMSMIGGDHQPASKLKDAKLDMCDYIIAYEQITKIMQDLYNSANLIHADLSEYNILWYNGQCYIIDVSQSVMPSHKGALEFLKRDCDNITNFFTKKQIPGIRTSDELFQSITGSQFDAQQDSIVDGTRVKPHQVNADGSLIGDYNFDEAWMKMQKTELVDPPLA